MRRNYIESTSFRRHVPTSVLINQCQIITFLILKSDNYRKFKDRIERNSFDSTFKSNLSYIYYYFTLQLGSFVIFFLFHIEIKGKGGWIIGGGRGGQRVCFSPPPPPPPVSNYWGRTPCLCLCLKKDFFHCRYEHNDAISD